MEDTKKRKSIVIPVDENSKEAFLNMCKAEDLTQGQLMRKLMKEKGYLNKDGSVKKNKEEGIR